MNHSAEHLYDRIINDFKDGYVMVSKSGIITDVNYSYANMVGYTREELIGMNIQTLEVTESPHEIDEHINKIYEVGHDEFETIHKRKDGSQVLLQVNTTYDRQALVFFTFVRDITYQRQKEEELIIKKYLLEKAQEIGKIGTWELDLIKNELIWTEQNYRNFGVPIGTKLTYEDFLSIVHPEDRDFVHRKWLAGVEDSPYDIEHRIIADGKVKWVLEKAELFKDETGKNVKAIGFTQDITERKEVEIELQKMKRLSSIGVLAGGIAHDFNNVLAGVYGNISLVKAEFSNHSTINSILEDALKSMSRATHLTTQLLTFAKGGEPIKETVKITKIVQDIVKFDLSGSNVFPRFHLENELWVTSVDVGQIQQAISNIVINAKEAMEEGGNLDIFISNMESINTPTINMGPCIKLSFKDEGIGIPAQNIDNIFDPYFSTKKTGTGLGLATTYSIIRKHDGYIHVESEFGKGTEITIYLPAIKDMVELERSASVENDPSTKLNSGKHYNVLVVEDEKEIQTFIARALVLNYHTVKTTGDVKEAIELYKKGLDEKNPFDLVIMDLTIPGGKGGKELVKEILSIDSNARCIVSSGYAEDAIISRYVEFGFKGCLVKPFTYEKLIDEINDVMRFQ